MSQNLINNHSIPGERGTKICGYNEHRKCLEFARKSLSIEPQIRMNCDLSSLEHHQISCNCLSRCNEIFYDYDMTYSDYSSDEEEVL